MTTRNEALELALRMGGNSVEAVLKNAHAFLNFLNADDSEDQPDTEAPKRGRKPKAEPDAAGVQEKMQVLQNEARAELKTVVDAGTGKEVVVGDADVDIKALRTHAKDMGVKLISQQGEAGVAGLLRKHAGIADKAEKATFGKVPDAAIPALITDFEALASME